MKVYIGHICLWFVFMVLRVVIITSVRSARGEKVAGEVNVLKLLVYCAFMALFSYFGQRLVFSGG